MVADKKKIVYNVWITVEEIAEGEEDNGRDINTFKFAQCLTEKKADRIVSEIERYEEEILSNVET